METKEVITLSIPIQGMTCGGCAANVILAILKLPGVLKVDVDLPARAANIVCDPNQVDLLEFQHAVNDAGYTIPTQEIHLTIRGMTCRMCVANVVGALADLLGILTSTVNLTEGTAQVIFIPALVTPTEMVLAIQSAGYLAAMLDPVPLASTTSNEQKEKDTDHSYNASRIGQVKRLFKRG